MPLNKHNSRTFHRSLFGGVLETVTLLKRDDDQREGTVKAIKLYECHRSRVQKTSEPISTSMTADNTTLWHIPVVELKRNGVNYLNVLDRIVDEKGRTWQPESPQNIDIKLFENYYDVKCVRLS